MGSVKGALGYGIAKLLCDFDRSWSEKKKPSMYLFPWEETLQQKMEEQKKRDKAYKRMFGVYPGQH